MINFYKNIMIFFLLFLVTIAIIYPKFNRVFWLEKYHPTVISDELSYKTNMDLDLPPNTGVGIDDYEYAKQVKYFRGEVVALLIAPFSYRLLTPYLASFLTSEARTAINIINIAALYLASVVIFLLAGQFFSGWIPVVCSLIFLISFPAFDYCVNARVDSLSIFMFTLLLWCTLNRQNILFVLVYMIGLLAKETIVLALVPFFVYNVMQHDFKKVMIVMFLLSSIFLLENYIVRAYFSSTSMYYWKPSFNYFLANVVRPKAIISLFLTLGLPGFISFVFLFKRWALIRRNQVLLTLYSGLLASLGLYFFSFFSAVADGRGIWVSYPYICLISGFYLEELRGSWRLSR